MNLSASRPCGRFSTPAAVPAGGVQVPQQHRVAAVWSLRLPANSSSSALRLTPSAFMTSAVDSQVSLATGAFTSAGGVGGPAASLTRHSSPVPPSPPSAADGRNGGVHDRWVARPFSLMGENRHVPKPGSLRTRWDISCRLCQSGRCRRHSPGGPGTTLRSLRSARGRGRPAAPLRLATRHSLPRAAAALRSRVASPELME